MSDQPDDNAVPKFGLESTAAAVSDPSASPPPTSGKPAGPAQVKHATGDTVGEFRIEGFIAEGGFGSVYRAQHPRLGRVALKLSHLPMTKVGTHRLSLQQNELEALMQLRHPALVKVLGHGALDDHRSFLALELIEGESLQAFMQRRGRVDAIEAIGIIRRIAEGIAHCHELKILHLDLAPKNVIMLDPYAPDLKIVDFGVAAFAENWLDVELRPAAGTPLYMAPELFNDAKIGTHCDVYALGLIFYELLTGRFPFAGATAAELWRNKMRGAIVPVAQHAPEVPEVIAKTVTALLDANPVNRGFSAASLAAHLKKVYFEILGRAEGRTSSPGTVTEVDARTVRLIGRDDEIAPVLSRAQNALSTNGEGWAVLLTGDPGIGKSRLLAELSDRLELGRYATGYGRCRQHGNLVSYAAWRECLGQLERVIAKPAHARGEAARRAVLQLLADPAVDDLFVLVPELEALRVAPAVASAPTGDVGSRRVSEAVRRFVTSICAFFPIALVLEDLHWADQGTLDVLGGLVSSPLPPGLLVMCTARPEPAVPEWPALARVPLGPLDDARSAELLRALAGDMSSEVLAELTAAIPLLKMGNPLVDIQLILHLKREGLLAVGPDGKVALAERVGKDYDPPTSVSSVLERRLREVPPRARHVLGIASLIGRQFRAPDLRMICAPELSTDEVDEAVQLAVELALCRTSGDEHVFAHDVIRDHLESTVPAEAQSELHGRIARTLRDRAPAATLAYHLDRAGDRAAAAAQYAQGGMEADRVHDLVGSSKNLRRALTLYMSLDPSPDRARALARTTYELVRITCLLGKTQEPLEDLDRCRTAMTAAQPDATVMVDSAYARVYYAQGKFEEAMDHSTRCLEVTDPALAPYQCVPANMLGRALCASGKFGPSVDVLRRGCQLARDTSDFVELSHSAGLLGTALAFIGDLNGSRDAIAESRHYAELLANPARRMGVCLYQTLYDEAAYRWHDGIRASAQLLAHSEEYAMAGLYLYLGTMMAGRHHFHIGELQRARHLLRNSINLSTLFSITTCKSWALAYLGDVYFVENRHDAALQWYMMALELARQGRGDGHGAPLALIGQAHASACLGVDSSQVHKLAQESFAAFEAASNVSGHAIALARYLDILDIIGGSRSAVEAKLAQLLLRLDVQACEFWPHVPANAPEPGVRPSDYWRYHSSAVIAENKVVVSGVQASSILVNLSTVDGFVPEFIAKPPRSS